MFSKQLKQLRVSRGLTQIDFAKEFNIATGTIGMWETGKREPDFDTIKRIAEYFGVSTDFLLGNSAFEKQELDPDIQEVINNPSEDIKELIRLINQMTPEEQQHLLDFAKLDAIYQAKKNKKNTPTE